jgi:hypothetical protein
MTWDPSFCSCCGHYIRNDWWHDPDCSRVRPAPPEHEQQPVNTGKEGA